MHQAEMASHCITLLVLSIFLYAASGRRTTNSTKVVPSLKASGLCVAVVIPNGYKCQEFEVTTHDGYILSMQRIPEGRTRGGEGARQPVLLQHGLTMDGITWLMASPEESLAYILADNGFDVWIANTRGTRWSSDHVTLDSSNPWSWDELVSYDLPATFDLVYQQTGQKLNYVGHSLGTLIALASFSEGRLMDKVRSAALLCPIAYLSHMTTPIGIVAARAFLGEIIENIGVAEFNPIGKVESNFLKQLCSYVGDECINLLSSFTGNNCCLNQSNFEFFLEYEPNPTSVKNMVHLSQTFRGGVIRKYSYQNIFLNILHYGSIYPPKYTMSNIPNNLPLFLSYGGRDYLADPEDVNLLLDDLKLHDPDKLTVQFVKDFAHLDFVMGVSARQIVYNAILEFFHSH